MSRLADAPADMLADIGEWLLTASAGEELLARVDAAARTER